MTDPGQSAGRPGILTTRLRLALWDAETVAAIRQGSRLPGWHDDFPRREDIAVASLWRDRDPWGMRSVVRTGAELVIGSIGFYSPPEPAADGVPEVEVAFGLVPQAHGYGFATEALLALMAPADAQQVRVRASIAPGNRAALRVAAKAGFTGIRGSTEDGELVLVRPPH